MALSSLVKVKNCLILTLSLIVFGTTSCNRSAPSAEKDNRADDGTALGNNASAPATISARPNPVPSGGKLGETTITWDTGTDQAGEVFVSRDGEPEKLVSTAPSGSKKIKWIAVKRHFEFRLYEGTEHKKVLGKVKVTHKS